MADPFFTSAAPDVPAGSERETKIEHLLLTGLDHYFDGQYDQAINVWTRALFLDRGHARARAYIERARAALAERQRESEELLQRGLAAFDRGASVEARRLLESAITRGAPRDEALSVLDRIQRLGPSGHGMAVDSVGPGLAGNPGPVATARGRWQRWLVWGGLAMATALVVVLLVALTPAEVISWRRTAQWAPSAPISAKSASPVGSSLAVPRRGERALGRARTLAQTGRLRDALATLEQVSLTDVERPAADRLRGEIQRQLLLVRQSLDGREPGALANVRRDPTPFENEPNAGRAP